ncbi:uncharacterized protein LOC110450287 [Mizuhopecten yessoensis]|uniref:Uncharacterized protein n=1 Tax=Mizuhopecten yessoensis TaxID=6573 RepID=A0A210QPC0_MIZYE|nr:uncharacterized protein LOC110450287 [Mizuhopecten yessoensis]OWF50580.1 hypothetical protein KP79_PYT18295 [Mizuhopecten yessoensis]
MSSSQTRKISTTDRKGVQSLFIPAVPQIVLNADEKADSNCSTIPHSRSAGELATCMAGVSGTSSKASSGNAINCNGKEAESRNVIDIYCSPRLPRRSFQQYGSHNSAHCDDDTNWLETYDSNTLPNKLGPGSRVGSAVSLTSEYTARSVGLISNDSSSDSTQFSDKLELIKHKQSLLRRYVSNPEKPNDVYDTQVQRCTKSVNNLNNECGQQMFVNQSNSSTDGSFPDLGPLAGVERELTKVKTQRDYEESDDGFSSTMVTMVTDELAVKEGRVRQWLTEMGSTNE